MIDEPTDNPMDVGDDVPADDGPDEDAFDDEYVDPIEDDATGTARPAGFDQLQAAAHEVISAARAVLDVAEDLLADPRTAEAVGSALHSIERAAGRAAATGRTAARGWAARQPGAAAGGHDGEDDEDDDGGSGVQRIPVS